MKTKMVIKKASMGGTSSGYTPSTAQNSNKISCDAYSQNGGQIMQKGSKLEKQKIGGMVKKRAVGGTTTKRIIKKSTGGMYGIPQENLGTSGQYGFAQKGGVIKAVKKVVKKITRPTLRKAQNGGYTVTNADGSPLTTPEGYRPPSVPSYPDFKKLKKTNPVHPAFMQLAKNPEEFDPKDVKKYGPKKPSKRMIREMSKEEAPMQTTPYKKGGTHKMPNGKVMLNSKMKKGGATKAAKFAALAPPYNKATFADRIVGAKKNASSKKLPKAQLGGLLKLAIRATKPLSKTLKPIAKKIVSKSKTTATKKFNYPKDKVKSMFPRVAEDVKKYNSETNPQKLFERKTIKEQMKQWDKAAELKQQKKYPVLKNKN